MRECNWWGYSRQPGKSSQQHILPHFTSLTHSLAGVCFPLLCIRDWGMALSASGIYGGVKLLAFDTAVLTGVHVQQHRSGDDFVLDVESKLLVPPSGDAGTIWIALPELGITDKIRLTMDGTLQEVRAVTWPGKSKRGRKACGSVIKRCGGYEQTMRRTRMHILKLALPSPLPHLVLCAMPCCVVSCRAQIYVRSSISVKASEVELWWPVGMGDQPLYNLTVTYASWSTWSDLIGLIGDLIGDIGDSINDVIGFNPTTGKEGPGAVAPQRAAAEHPDKAARAAAAAAAGALKMEDPRVVKHRVLLSMLQAEEGKQEAAPLKVQAQVTRTTPAKQPAAAATAQKPAAAAPSTKQPATIQHAPQFPETEQPVKKELEPIQKKAGSGDTDAPNKQQTVVPPSAPTNNPGGAASYEPRSVHKMHSRVRRMVAEGKLSPAFFPGVQQIDTDGFMSTVNRKIGFRVVEVSERLVGASGGRCWWESLLLHVGACMCGVASKSECGLI